MSSAERRAKLDDDEITQFSAVLVDVGMAQYQIEWQRVAMMQQSAGILIAALAIIYSIFGSLISQQQPLNLAPTLLRVVVPTLVCAVLFSVLTTYFFFRVISRKRIKALAPPTRLLKETSGDLRERTYRLVVVVTAQIETLHEHVEQNQMQYARGLTACRGAFILTAGLVGLVLARPVLSDTSATISIMALTIITLLSLYFVITPDRQKDGR
jgi:hypothetical protein